MSRIRKVGVASALLGLAVVAVASTALPSRVPAIGNAVNSAKASVGSLFGASSSEAAVATAAGGRVLAPVAPPQASDTPERYIVVFQEPALAGYKGEISGLAAPARRVDARGKSRLDVKSASARNYVNYLQGRQSDLVGAMALRVGRPIDVEYRMQHALNGVMVELTTTEAARIEQLPDVQLVEAYREYALDTDTGPRLIGSEAVWNGTWSGATGQYQGEGIVYGILDSGINFGAPSFTAVDPVDGYQHVNPLGAGNYLGTCRTGEVDAGRCNDKLIGGYNFVCGAPGNVCGQPNIREEPGFGDTNGHGSHVASTVAGNRRDALFRGNTRRISGVAPRGNIVAYDICYTNTATGQGLCPNNSAVAAVNQAIADGIVDVLNYSVGGGAQPWTEAVSLAFLNATDAGIFVASSAGNSGPGPNTMGHLEPWVSSTAASQHGRGSFALALDVTGPGNVPEPLRPVLVEEGTGGVAFNATIPGTTPLRVSARIDTGDDGCAAFPANSFQGAIAVVRRGTCSFAIKADAARAAGAIAVVIANNAAGAIIPSVPGATIPVFGMPQADANALRDFVAANPTATAGVQYPPLVLPNVADALGAFSSRGPAGTFDLVKPDVTAPGVSILAVIAGTTITGFENAVDLYNGTSMASPHQAGAAGLIRQARPTWSVPEIKSALAMTAKTEVFKEDQVTVGTPFDKGSGRIQVDRAINAGLVMHETKANYLAADPALGGNVSALNQPSMANRNCYSSCTFVRTFRNPHGSASSWRISFSGVSATATPSTLKVPAGGSASVRITVNTRGMAPNGTFSFGEMRLQSTGPILGVQRAPLTLPIAIAIQAPVVKLPDAISLALAAGRSGTAVGSVGNTGGSPLIYSIDNTGNGAVSLVDNSSLGVASGFRNTSYTDPATAGAQAQYSADDFVVERPLQLTSLSAPGFVVSGTALTTAATSLTWSIYPDANGVPAGNPTSGVGAAIWSYTAAPTAAGVSVAGTALSLNLPAAGQSLTLQPGRYWLVASTRGTFANRFAQYGSTAGNGSFASITVAANGTGAWASNTAFPGLAMTVKGLVPCGAPWIGAVTPASGTVLSGATQANRVALNAAGLGAGRQLGYLCVASNDPVTPKAATPVVLTVN
ncbi:Protease domain-containing protein [Luteimonas sp. 9C]|uniref:S8 family serine peptidase n=1 Tax=Luteimonas sp. 9C TaxID=2653148 RepID=UPI0012EF5C92|nr:S8 family serine peptidase [Luteimonas sp. 9C]VXC13163.1 Protease domain-containing protein [Luteimonas sp. 9C]